VDTKEKAVRIGKPTPLIGVVCEPVACEPVAIAAERPAVLLLNSGVMHHVGACRASVRIARQLAEAGFVTLRFDYSGIGDSEPRRGAAAFEETAITECREIMDYLGQTRGIKKFVLYGLCSGADAAYFTSLNDERVVGIIQIDAFCYRTWRYYWNYYKPRLFNSKHWVSSMNRLLTAIQGNTAKAPLAQSGIEEAFFVVPTYTRVIPPRAQIRDGLAVLTARDVGMLVMFTGDEPHYNYENQYVDSFSDIDFTGGIDVKYLRKANHIVTQPWAQRDVLETIASWIETRYSGTVPPNSV
jgi:hypothetical protein